MIKAYVITLILLAVLSGGLLYMMRVNPDADKLTGPPRPGLAAEYVEHRRKKRLKRRGIIK